MYGGFKCVKVSFSLFTLNGPPFGGRNTEVVWFGGLAKGVGKRFRVK